MKTSWKSYLIGINVLLLWASLVTGAQSENWRHERLRSELGKGWVQFHARILCAACSIKELPIAQPTRRKALYELKHYTGQVVVEMTSQEEPLSYDRLWLKTDEQTFGNLMKEENLFKQIEVSGLLREYMPTSGTLDLATVTIVDEPRG